MISQYIVVVVGIFFLSGCKNGFKENEILEIRKYEVRGELTDSVWCDTLYASAIRKEGLGKVIHDIDSVLSNNRIDMFRISGSTVNIQGYDNWKEVDLIKYTVQMPIKYGELSFYGIYAKDVGTVYWRWLDGRKALMLKEKRIKTQSRIYDELANYLDTTILAIPPKPIYREEESNEELNQEIEIDIP